ncbi:12702_t:CDS:2 [Entrophospora sp. SA101]|nr:12702_t:CDS:2 [Entrophospora sp. SA101]
MLVERFKSVVDYCKNITTTSQKQIAKEICLNSKVEIGLNQSMISKIYNGGEQRLVELPKFNGDIDDPYQWWRSFNEACEANNISLERRLQIAPTCLKGQAEVWRKTPGLVFLTWYG